MSYAGDVTARPMVATVVTERKIEKEIPIYQLLPASKYTAIEPAGARVFPRFPGDKLCSFDERVF
jgi:hypothetical protein